jgi:hypothetical protein
MLLLLLLLLLQALMLMYQLLAGRNAVSERYYRALYTVLLTEGARGAAGDAGGDISSLWRFQGEASVSRARVHACTLHHSSQHVCRWRVGVDQQAMVKEQCHSKRSSAE